MIKELFFLVLGPMIWLLFFAYAFAVASHALEKAWKSNDFKLIWLNIWIILIGVYFLLAAGLK